MLTLKSGFTYGSHGGDLYVCRKAVLKRKVTV